VTGATAKGTAARRVRDPLYSALIGLTSLTILLQGLWAGLFIREGKDFDETSSQANWVTAHQWGASVAAALALASLIVALLRLRARRDLVIGTALLLLALILEGFIGGGIGDHASWPSFHIPLAMLLMSLSVWLAFRAARGRSEAA
jgi:heme A synthase